MENASQYLLSSKNRSRYTGAIRQLEHEFEELEGRWSVIGKYHERLWFQRLWRANISELLYEYRRCAMLMENIEKSITEYKSALYLHTCAVEFLNSTNKPFQNLNLSQHTLEQQTLFDDAE